DSSKPTDQAAFEVFPSSFYPDLLVGINDYASRNNLVILGIGASRRFCHKICIPELRSNIATKSLGLEIKSLGQDIPKGDPKYLYKPKAQIKKAGKARHSSDSMIIDYFQPSQ